MGIATPIPIFVIYIVGGLILAVIAYSFVRDLRQVKVWDKKKIVGLITLCILVTGFAVGLGYGVRASGFAEHLFPAWYDKVEIEGKEYQIDRPTWEDSWNEFTQPY